jgi:zinc transport system substrate-binding protein
MKLLRIFCCIPLLFGCGNTNTLPLQKPVIIVTLPPYETLVKEVVGDAFEIRTLIKEGVDPHVFELSAKDTEQFYGAALWFSTGDPQEKKYLATLQEHFPALEYIDLSKSFTPLTYEEDTKFLQHHTTHNTHDHHHASIDYHIWMSPEFLIPQVQQIVSMVRTMDPIASDFFVDRGDLLIDRLTSLNQRYKTLLEKYQGDAVLVTHPAYGYFTHAYHLKQISIESEGKEIRLKDLVETFPTLKTQSIRSVISQPQTSRKPAELFARELDLPLYTIDPNLADYEKTYNLLLQAITYDR